MWFGMATRLIGKKLEDSFLLGGGGVLDKQHILDYPLTDNSSSSCPYPFQTQNCQQK